MWRHNGRDGVSNHQPQDCLLNHSFRRRSRKTSKLWVTGLCEGNSTVTGEFPAQRASNAESVSIWWRQHGSSWTFAFMERNIPHIYVYWCQLISNEFHTRRWNPIIEPFSFLYQTVRKHDRFNNGTAVYEHHLSSVTWAPWHNAMICSTDYRMMTSSNGNIFRVTGPLCGELTGHRWISRTEASGAELWCFLRSASE